MSGVDVKVAINCAKPVLRERTNLGMNVRQEGEA
jgi:hypothetical protein